MVLLFDDTRVTICKAFVPRNFNVMSPWLLFILFVLLQSLNVKVCETPKRPMLLSCL